MNLVLSCFKFVNFPKVGYHALSYYNITSEHKLLRRVAIKVPHGKIYRFYCYMDFKSYKLAIPSKPFEGYATGAVPERY